VVPPARRLLNGEPVTLSWFHKECVSKITGVAAAPKTDTQPTDKS